MPEFRSEHVPPARSHTTGLGPGGTVQPSETSLRRMTFLGSAGLLMSENTSVSRAQEMHLRRQQSQASYDASSSSTMHGHVHGRASISRSGTADALASGDGPVGADTRSRSPRHACARLSSQQLPPVSIRWIMTMVVQCQTCACS